MKKSLCKQCRTDRTDKQKKNNKNVCQEVKSRVLRALDEYSMLDSGGIIVAFSGGADSRVLLELLGEISRERGIPIACAHVNHMLRGRAADRDEAFCRAAAERAQIPIFVLKLDVFAYAKERSLGIEEAAREVRYSYFERLLSENSEYTRIATAHNANDNAETVLFNLARGGGIKGISGIPPKRDNIVRPLIYVTRKQIEEYCRVKELKYVTDKTNFSTDYSRNYIRWRVLPVMNYAFGDFTEAATRASRNLRADSEYLTAVAEESFETLYKNGQMPLDKLQGLPRPILARVLILAYERAGGSALAERHVDALISQIKKNAQPFSLDLPSGLHARGERGALSFSKARAQAESYRIELKEGENILPSGDKIYICTEACEKNTEPTDKVYNLSISAEINDDTINGVLYARSRENGDSYRIGGMTRKLKKLFCDRKMTIDERNSLPIICDGEGILWVPNFSVRDGAKAKSGHKTVNIYYTSRSIQGGHYGEI
ncbi:MAG: tRNA lysidine(34) synthetase TilS [Clostridia bacterium]|nr:tRNA lysidine(34) synthetase TilS [Clostridia bacterium]